MAIHKIPVDKLSTKALQGVIEEFISREGTLRLYECIYAF
jgi:uncharacterized protein YheU (UPF0270 family)